MHRVKCIVHRVKYIESYTESEVHRVEYPTYLRLNRLIYISVYLSFFLKPEPAPMPSIGNATLCADWHGRAREPEVKLQQLGAPRNPLRGLAWSSAQTQGKVATLPRVRALDHANPGKGLRVTPKSCNFTLRSRARPRQSTQRVARHAYKSCNFTPRSRARPRQSTQRVARHA